MRVVIVTADGIMEGVTVVNDDDAENLVEQLRELAADRFVIHNLVADSPSELLEFIRKEWA